MKTTALLIALFLAGAADELAPVTVGALRLNAPAAWNKTVTDGTTRYAAPSGEAYFEVDVGTVQTPGGLAPGVCLNKITTGIGGEWTRLSVGSNPAAMKTDVDTDSDKREFITQTYVGCNGKTTWSLSFHMVATKKDRFAPLAEKITQSIQYAR
ncbi:MAG TPA: hypothetical protein VK447_14705 [Myxococcaceae bacterium]|nr:hypothetical protein [Myxococcaceae bacterium]